MAVPQVGLFGSRFLNRNLTGERANGAGEIDIHDSQQRMINGKNHPSTDYEFRPKRQKCCDPQRIEIKRPLVVKMTQCWNAWLDGTDRACLMAAPA